MVKTSSRSKITRISKTLNPTKAYGEYIGMAKFSNEDAEALIVSINYLVVQLKEIDKYYEATFEHFIKNGHDLHSLKVSDLEWAEIDTIHDLEEASAKWQKKESIKNTDET